MRPSTPARSLIDDDGLAAYLGHITQRQIRDLRYRRQVPYIKIGNVVRYDLDKIDAWLASRSVEVSP